MDSPRRRVAATLGRGGSVETGARLRYFSPLKPPHEWTLRFSGICPPARDEPRHLDFVEPARLAPDKLKNAPKNAPPPPLKLGLYIHSENAEGVVYNNQRHRGVTLEDAHVRVLSGVARGRAGTERLRVARRTVFGAGSRHRRGGSFL